MMADRSMEMATPRQHQGRRQRGTALVEFALVFPLLLVVTLAVVDMSRAFFVKNLAYQAAREGVRELVVRSAADSATVRQRVMQVTSAANVTLGNITIAGPTGDQMMGVTVGVRFDWLFLGLFNWLGTSFTNPATLTGAAWMRKEGA